MPAYLSEGCRQFNQLRRVSPRDPIGQLEYYTSSQSVSMDKSLHSSASDARGSMDPPTHYKRRSKTIKSIWKTSNGSDRSAANGSTNESLTEFSDRSTAVLDRVKACASPVSSLSSYYSNSLLRALKNRRNSILNDHKSRKHEVKVERKNKDGDQWSPNLDDSKRNVNSNTSKSISSQSVLLGSSGFSEGTFVGSSQRELFSSNHSKGIDDTSYKISGKKLMADPEHQSTGSHEFDDSSKGNLTDHHDEGNQHHRNFFHYLHHTNKHEENHQPRKRSSRTSSSISNSENIMLRNQRAMIQKRSMSKYNRRFRHEHLMDPYAFGELFSQSEIPGFREIFASDSYLRKFCWIVAFLVLTLLSLNDMTELITEYLDHPISVGVRLRDSAKLPFPSVTVCNLNVVRYSALCGSTQSARDLNKQMPSGMLEKLCGSLLEKKNASEVDIIDINNIGITPSPSPAEFKSTRSSLDIPTGVNVMNDQMKSTSPPVVSYATTPRSPTTVSGRKSELRQADRHLYPINSDLKSDYFTTTWEEVTWTSSSGTRNGRTRHERSLKVEANGRPFASGKVRTKPWAENARPPSDMVDPVAQAVQLPTNNLRGGIQINPNTGGQSVVTVANSHGLGVSQMPATSIPNQQMNPTTMNPMSPPALPDDFELSERQERELQENLTNWLAVMYNRDPINTKTLGHQFEDMVLRCTMKSVNCTHQRSFHQYFTPTEGSCFTYKSKAKRRSSKLNNHDQYEDANLAGPNHGLELVLNLEKGEYISGSSQVGALVMVHHPNDVGYAASEATFIAPEFTTYIGLKMVNITRLKAPHPEHCVDTWPSNFAENLRKNSTYSQQLCLRTCLQKTIQNHCQCQSALLPTVDLDIQSPPPAKPTTENLVDPSLSSQDRNQSSKHHVAGGQKPPSQRIIICDTRKDKIRQCVRDLMFSGDRVQNCECPPKCEVIRYDKTISMARWPTKEDKGIFDRKMDVNFQNLAKVIVYFQSMTCEEVSQQAVTNIAKLFSSLGGIMGMYVGFSCLSVFEIFEVMSRKMWHHFMCKLNNRKMAKIG